MDEAAVSSGSLPDPVAELGRILRAVECISDALSGEEMRRRLQPLQEACVQLLRATGLTPPGWEAFGDERDTHESDDLGAWQRLCEGMAQKYPSVVPAESLADGQYPRPGGGTVHLVPAGGMGRMKGLTMSVLIALIDWVPMARTSSAPSTSTSAEAYSAADDFLLLLTALSSFVKGAVPDDVPRPTREQMFGPYFRLRRSLTNAVLSAARAVYEPGQTPIPTGTGAYSTVLEAVDGLAVCVTGWGTQASTDALSRADLDGLRVLLGREMDGLARLLAKFERAARGILQRDHTELASRFRLNGSKDPETGNHYGDAMKTRRMVATHRASKECPDGHKAWLAMGCPTLNLDLWTEPEARLNGQGMPRSAMAEAARRIRAFLHFVDTLDRDARGDAVCDENRPTLENLWGAVCESVNAAGRELIERLPTGAGGRVNLSTMSPEDRALLDVLSQALWRSALTRFTPDGTPWLEAAAKSIDPSPVGRRIVEADRMRKLAAVARQLEAASPTPADKAAIIAANSSLVHLGQQAALSNVAMGSPPPQQWPDEALTWPRIERREARELTPSPPAAGDESGGPVLTENQRQVLMTLAIFDASRLLSCAQIAAEMEPQKRLSEEIVRQCIVEFLALDLAERPRGTRNGARLTVGGRRLAAKIAD